MCNINLLCCGLSSIFFWSYPQEIWHKRYGEHTPFLFVEALMHLETAVIPLLSFLLAKQSKSYHQPLTGCIFQPSDNFCYFFLKHFQQSTLLLFLIYNTLYYMLLLLSPPLGCLEQEDNFTSLPDDTPCKMFVCFFWLLYDNSPSDLADIWPSQLHISQSIQLFYFYCR